MYLIIYGVLNVLFFYQFILFFTIVSRYAWSRVHYSVTAKKLVTGQYVVPLSTNEF